MQAYRRLGRGLILRNLAAIGLCKTTVRHFDARIHQKTIVEIRAHHATNTTLPILTGTKKIWRRRTVPSPTRYFAAIKQKRNKTGAENCRKYSMLRESRLMVLSTIASEQTKGTERTLEKAYQVLDYLATHPNTVVRFRASDMVMNIHPDVSYLSEPKAHSRACGHFFVGALPKDGDPIKLNGAFHTLCSILRFVVASAAEAELGALFLNCQ